jgi:predicted nucleic acid-binding protein
MSVATFAIDTSCMIAAVCTWHERHAAAAAGIERRLERGARVAVAAHALVETYAVLTRLPAPHRLAPAVAWTLVKANFVDRAKVVVLGGEAHVSMLADLATRDIGGGRSYDALISACAVQSGVDELLTFNPRHFDSLPAKVAVVEPGDR